jgi:hypothetical protein
MSKLLRCGKLIDGSGKPGKLDMALYIEGTVIKAVMSWDEVPIKSHTLTTQNSLLFQDSSTLTFTW